MAKSTPSETLRDENWAAEYPEPLQRGASFYHAGGVTPAAMAMLRGKGYTPVDFRQLTGEEKIEAMIEATQNGVFSPDSAQTKLIDLHLKQIRGKTGDEEEHDRDKVLEFLELLQNLTSQERPEWVSVGAKPTPASSTPKVVDRAVVIADLMGDMNFDSR